LFNQKKTPEKKVVRKGKKGQFLTFRGENGCLRPMAHIKGCQPVQRRKLEARNSNLKLDEAAC